MKITKTQIQELVKEEIIRYKKIKSLQERKEYLKKQLNEFHSSYGFKTEEDKSYGGDNLRAVKITFSDGDTITTNMAAGLSDEDIYDYYKIGRMFNLGDGAGGDNMQTVTDVEILK